jgi:DNA (cytosine-5)-methyltransferase 1
MGNSLRAANEYVTRGVHSAQGPETERGCHGHRCAGPTGGFWSDADWIYCRDGKWRPVESGTLPLAARVPARVGRLRGYGNAIVAPLAAEFIKAYLESQEGRLGASEDRR